MKTEIRTQWATALRSGEYLQGTGYLHEQDTYCCLGVLCALAAKAGIVHTETDCDERVAYISNEDPMGKGQSSNTILPKAVADWAGLPDTSPEVELRPDSEYCEDQDDCDEYECHCVITEELTTLNDDRGYDFTALADLIERNF